MEFVTRSGVLVAKRIDGGIGEGSSSIELDFPVMEVMECEESELPLIPMTLGGASVVAVKKIGSGDLLVELASGKDVAELQPEFDELRKCAGREVLITGPAPHASGFDFFSRFFCPKFGVDEDLVCGSAHCALAPYWRKKLGKCNLVAYMASSRSGRLDLYLEETTQCVHLRGEAVTVMNGTLLA